MAHAGANAYARGGGEGYIEAFQTRHIDFELQLRRIASFYKYNGLSSAKICVLAAHPVTPFHRLPRRTYNTQSHPRSFGFYVRSPSEKNKKQNNRSFH